jgi:predicted oxidoreductase
MNPHEVAAAFTQLREQGKVREFGVSNFRPAQVNLLQGALPFPLIVNQVEISLAALGCFEDGTLDLCIAREITPLAWSPLAGGLLAGGAHHLLPWQEKYRVEKMLAELDAQAHALGTSRGNVALAWLMKHPANIVPIVGSTRPEKIREAALAADIELSRESWYRLLEAARGERLP